MRVAVTVGSCYNAASSGQGAGIIKQFMVTRIGSLATTSCEPGQAWKGAAAAVDLGAGVWLVRAASISFRVIRQLLYNPVSYPEAADYS